MLKIEGLSVHYGRSQALFDVSVYLAAGEFVTIIGANGAGKTTLIKSIMGLVPVTAGRILFEGFDITRLPPWRRAELNIGYIPEGRRLFPDLSVQENLILGGWIRKDETSKRRQMEKVFSLFPRLAERKDQLARTMSGGEQQMLAIGRALMLEPRLLLVDEISMGLMPILVNTCFQTLAAMNSLLGVTILLVEQNAKKALLSARRAYVLETGRIVLAGAAADLMKDERLKKAYLGGYD